MLFRSTVISADTRCCGLVSALTLLLLGRTTGVDGFRGKYPEYLRHCLGDKPFGQRVSRHLVLFSGPGPFRHDPTGDKEGTSGQGQYGG